MNKIIFLILILCNVSYGQDVSTTINDSYDSIEPVLILKAGSCGSPDGGILEIASPPASYQQLEDDGYCFAGINSSNTVTMCFTFTPDVATILLNGGYSESCANNNFTGFRVYDNTCTLVSTSLNPTGLTAGQQYTWCIDMKAWGGPSCNGYTTFCPYWINDVPLPIELLYFNGEKHYGFNLIEWGSASEINNDYYTIEKSQDGKNWEYLSLVYGAGTTTELLNYEFRDYYVKDTINYYKLSQTDFNGNSKTFKIIVVNNSNDYRQVRITVNLLGQEVDENEKGLFIEIYTDGSTRKIFRQ